jgi:hypothetical protein
MPLSMRLQWHVSRLALKGATGRMSLNRNIISSVCEHSEEKDIQNQTCILNPFLKTVSPSSKCPDIGITPLTYDPGQEHIGTT